MLTTPKHAKPTVITRLAAMPVVHKAIVALRLQQMASKALGVVPFKRKMRGGCEYRVRSLESFVMADEIFSRELYREAFDGRKVETVVDLGANVGYFTLFAAGHTNNRDLIALMVDANEKVMPECAWHVKRNNLSRVSVKYGVVGFPKDMKEATFYVNPSNVASSAQPELNPNIPAKGESVPVKVPTVDVESEWNRIAGDRRIDLLKIDIEGSECDFIKNSRPVLDRTDRVVLEWHKWVVSLDQVKAMLSDAGFTMNKVIGEDDHCGVAIFDRRANAPS
jgi:FkbM family methyltransferase